MGTLTDNVLSKCEVQSLLKSVLEEENVKDAVLQISSGSEKGDGYLSFITRVDVQGSKDLHLIVKCAPRSEEFRKLAPLRVCYIREVYVYDTVFPNLRKFQKERNVERPFRSVAKCYKTSLEEGKELLVLENIKERGFRLWNRQKYMNDEHVTLVFEEYGKLHGTSFAMKDQDGKTFEGMEQNLQEIFTRKNTPPEMFNMFFDAMDKLKDLFCPEEEKEYHERAQNLKDIVESFFEEAEENPGDYTIICHGDCWCNNMMFKYNDPENPNKPTELCLLDFQITKIASPVIDLSYFFYVSSPKEFMDNIDHYLKIYHRSLCRHMRALGSDPEKLFPFSALKSEWKRFGKFGFIMSTLVFKAMLRDKEEIVDFSDITDDKSFLDVFGRECKSDVLVNKRLKNLISHLFENDFI